MDAFSTDLERIIQGILTPDQDILNAAQAAYFNAEKSNPEQLFLSLATVMKLSQHLPCRIFAAVILRRESLPKKMLIGAVSPAGILQIKQTALELFKNEPNPTIRNKVIEFAAVFASRLFKQQLDANPAVDPSAVWPELLQLTFGGCKTDQPLIQQACFNMLSLISEFCVQVFSAHQVILAEVITAGLQSSNNLVAIGAANSLASLLISTQNLINQLTQPGIEQNLALISQYKTYVAQYTTLIPQCCQIFALAIENNAEELLSDFVDNLDSIAMVYPEAFAQCFSPLLQLLNKICRQDEIEESFRSRCLNIFVSFSKTPQGRSLARSSSKVSKKESYETIVMSLAFDLLQDIDDSNSWSSDPNNLSEDEDEFPNHYLGLFLISCLPLCLGLKTFLPTLLKAVLQKAATIQNWKQCHAALRVFHLLAQNHIKSFPKESIPPILTMFTTLSEPKVLKQSNPRVAVALFESILAFASKLNAKVCKTLLPYLMHYISPAQAASAPPTQTYYAARALSAQIGILNRVSLAPFASEILSSAVNLLNHPNCPVKNTSLGVISLLAFRLGKNFEQYSDQIMSGLCQTLASLNAFCQHQITSGEYDGSESTESQFYQQRTVKNKIIESIAFICEALDAEIFSKYAASCMQLITESQNIELQCSSPYLETIFVAFTKISETLQADFAPYLPTILPGILKAASAQNFSYRFDLDADENLNANDQIKANELLSKGFSTLTVGIRGEGMQNLFINSAIIQDKIRSLEILGEFCITLKESLCPYLPEIASVLFPECTTTVNPRIRWSSTVTVPAMFECFVSQKNLTDAQIIQFFSQCMGAFKLEEWVERELPQGLHCLINAATATVDAMCTKHAHLIPNECFTLLSNALLKGWSLCLERRHNIEQEVSTGDEEHAQLKAESMAVENQNLDACTALNTQLLRCSCEKYFPFAAQHVEPLYAAAVDPVENIITVNGVQRIRDPYLYTCGIVGYSDMIGVSGTLGLPFISKIFPSFLKAVGSSDPLLRRGAAYGISASHRAMPMAQFAPFVEQTVNALVAAMAIEYTVEDDDEGETQEDNNYALDNVLGGLTDIISRYSLGEQLPYIPHEIDASCANPALQQIIPNIVQTLPRFYDEGECRTIHHNYILWLQKIPAVVYGENNSLLPNAVRIYAHILDLIEDYDVCDDQDVEALKAWYAQVKASLPEAVMDKIKSVIDPDFVHHL